MHFPNAPQHQKQQRADKDYPQSHTPNMSYPPNVQSPHPQAYPSSYGIFGGPTHFNSTTYAMHQSQQQQHYASEQQQQPQQQQYDIAYGRLIAGNIPGSGGPVGSSFSNRARYLPYEQSLPAHPMRGMYTPAGQQLIPSSVLHYPPRGAPYQQSGLPSQQQRSLTHHTSYTLPQHTQPQSQPQLRQQQQSQLHQKPQSQSPLHCTNSFGGNELPQMRLYGDGPNMAQVQHQPQYTPAARSTPHLIAHLNGGSPPATPAPTPPSPAPTPTPTPPPQNIVRPPSVDCNAYTMHLQRQQQQTQLLQQYRQQPNSLSPCPTPQRLSNNALSSLRTFAAKQYQSLSPQVTPPLVEMLPASRESSELPTISGDAAAATAGRGTREGREEEEKDRQPSHSVSHILGNRDISSANNLTRTNTVCSPRLTVSSSSSSSDCLTTSPPLISATGTDSGISVGSCSTRARSDSTQSTPIYNGEYPMSVGSSSGVSYHCADIKDFEEFGREKEEQSVCSVQNENENLKLKQEIGEGEINDERLKGSAVDGENMITSNVKKEFGMVEHLTSGSTEEMTTYSDDKRNQDDVEDNVSACTLEVRMATSNSPVDPTKHLPVKSPAAQLPEDNSTKKSIDTPHLDAHMNTSANEESKTDCKELAELQQQKQNEAEATPQNTENTRTTFAWASSTPHSPNQNLNFEHTQLHQRELPSPPVPPAPPQNSPVDYNPVISTTNMGTFAYTALPAMTPLKPPTNAAAAAAAAAVAAAAAAAAAATIRTNKSRLMESDLIGSKKSKRKTHLVSGKRQKDNEENETSEGGNDKRDMTPLPGFQQAFGSTEIGRFFETFLLSPPDCHSFNDNYDSFNVEEQLQQIHQQQQQQQQHQLQMQHEQQQQQQQLQVNQIYQQHQHQQQYNTSHDYFSRRYSDNGSFHTQRLHANYTHQHLPTNHPYYRGQSHPPYPINGGNSYRDMWLYGRRAPSPYDLPYEYAGARTGSGSPASPYEMPLSARTPYGSSYDRMGYSYGRINGSFSGIRCNGY